MKRNIKAILFDSGRVLNGPLTGHWFISPNFFQHIDKNLFDAISPQSRQAAFSKASEYINVQSLIATKDQELEHFTEYYRVFLSHLPQLKAEESASAEIAKDLVYNSQKYTFFQDALELIPNVAKDYKLAIVSDAWPSLEDVFVGAGLREYFCSFVISSILGTAKPDRRMYEAALTELRVQPQEAIFIDDNPVNCDGAKALGIITCLISRDYKTYIYHKLTNRNHFVIRNLSQLKNILK